MKRTMSAIEKVNSLLREAEKLCAQAEELSRQEGAKNEYFDWSPAYGVGGWLKDGLWNSSSEGC